MTNEVEVYIQNVMDKEMPKEECNCNYFSFKQGEGTLLTGDMLLVTSCPIHSSKEKQNDKAKRLRGRFIDVVWGSDVPMTIKDCFWIADKLMEVHEKVCGDD